MFKGNAWEGSAARVRRGGDGERRNREVAMAVDGNGE